MAVDKALAYQLREQGMTFDEIAKEVGCSGTHIRTMMSGVPRGKKYEPLSVESELKRLAKELMDLSKRFGE